MFSVLTRVLQICEKKIAAEGKSERNIREVAKTRVFPAGAWRQKVLAIAWWWPALNAFGSLLQRRVRGAHGSPPTPMGGKRSALESTTGHPLCWSRKEIGCGVAFHSLPPLPSLCLSLFFSVGGWVKENIWESSRTIAPGTLR